MIICNEINCFDRAAGKTLTIIMKERKAYKRTYSYQFFDFFQLPGAY